MARQTKEQGRQIVQMDQLRKKRQHKAFVRRICGLMGIAVLLVGIGMLNRYFVQENITNRLSDLVSGIGGGGYPVSLPGGVIRDIKGVGNQVAVLNDTNLLVYNKNGKQMANHPRMAENTVLLTNDKRLLTYGQNAQKYAVHSKTKTLFEEEMAYPMITATINARGDYALVSSSKNAACEINVYNRYFEKNYICYIANHTVSSVSLSPKADRMAAAWVDVENGTLYSGITLYRLSTEEETEVKLSNDMILQVRYLDDRHIVVLTDRQYVLLDENGTIKQSYPFNGRMPVAVEQTNKHTLLLLGLPNANTQDLVVLNQNLEEEASRSFADAIIDIALSERNIYVLQKDGIYVYHRTFALDTAYAVTNASSMTWIGNQLFYLTKEHLTVLENDTQELVPSALDAQTDTDAHTTSGQLDKGKNADESSSPSASSQEAA